MQLTFLEAASHLIFSDRASSETRICTDVSRVCLNLNKHSVYATLKLLNGVRTHFIDMHMGLTVLRKILTYVYKH